MVRTSSSDVRDDEPTPIVRAPVKGWGRSYGPPKGKVYAQRATLDRGISRAYSPEPKVYYAEDVGTA